jgi:3-deoxy-D-manno-octulosonic-acid transferase
MDSVRGNRSHTTDQRLIPMAEFAEGFSRVIIGGSTWPEDEALLVRYVEQQNEWSEQPVKMILVPHEINPQHLHYIFNLLRGRLTTYSAVSQMKDAESRRNILRRADVLVVDTMGLLSATYRYGQVAYVGGGFGEGIHNTVEPAAFGMPVIFGPKYHHFREAEGLIAAGAARSIRRYDELAAALDEALNQHTEIGTRAADYVQAELGATDKIYKEIF